MRAASGWACEGFAAPLWPVDGDICVVAGAYSCQIPRCTICMAFPRKPVIKLLANAGAM